MTERYTAADFANARFAEHGTENDPAVRRPDVKGEPWRCACGGTWSDEDMADMNWVPAPTKPTITDSEVGDIAEHKTDDWLDGFMAGYEKAGGTILDEPTRERVARLIGEELGLTIGANGDALTGAADRLIKLGLVEDK